MTRIVVPILTLVVGGLAFGGIKPLANVSKYNGKFMWVKLGEMSAATVKNLAHAKSILIDLSFPRDVKIKKDAHGNQWFTLILADQGSDWKWNQTKGSAVVPISGGMIKAGKYTVSVPIAGLPKSVLADNKQSISLGPNTSGLVGAISFSVDHLSGR